MRQKRHQKLWLLAAILTLVGMGIGIFCLCSQKESISNERADNVRIAIAWRADTDNEFCANVVEAFKAAGADVIVLPQVKAPYVSYNGTEVSASCLDGEGIGYLSKEYGAMVRAKGYQGSNANANDILADVKGVVFTGGEDIAPTLYAVQEDWHHVATDIDYNAARDVSDYLTMTYCLDHDIPVIGLCRGAQMLGVVSGATMIQDIPTWFAARGKPYHYEHRREKSKANAYRDYTPHTVNVTDGSLLSDWVSPLRGGKRATALQGCPSWHHQSLLSVEGTPLRVVGTTTTSGVDMVEAVERTDKTCAIGLQFHPEAAITKHLGKGVCNGNANQFMTYDEAMAIIKAFIGCCSTANKTKNGDYSKKTAE